MAELKQVPQSEARRIAQFMDLPSWKTIDDLGLVASVKLGFPARTAKIVVQRIDPDERFVRVGDIIPKTTLHRRKGQSLTKDESEKLLALSKVFSEVLRLYHSDMKSAANFLMQLHPMLGNRSPIDLAKESISGADLVMKLLAKADAGIAA